MGKTIKVVITGLVVSCLTLLANVYAEDQKSCADDVVKFCKDVQPGGGRINKCLKEHETEISPSCKERLEQLKKELQEAKNECADDIVKLCGDVKPGQGRIVSCLKEHENELSDGCRATFEKHKPRAQKIKKIRTE